MELMEYNIQVKSKFSLVYNYLKMRIAVLLK